LANILLSRKQQNMIDQQSLLERFLRYVCIESMAVADVDRYPSSEGQLQMGRLLVDELQQLGMEATQDKHGIVVGTIPGNVPGAPVVALNSHVDTSPETSGANVKPNILENYDGKEISLGDSGITITLEENPELSSLVGKTLITTDGTTLLGADDKAGVAIIMQVAATLMQHPEIPHGEVRILFTCDEEIGLGVKHVDIAALAADVCYTLDGGGAGDIDTETFSADGATVTVHGTNIHPSIAKNRMVNSIKALSEFLVRLPSELSPECTDGRDGFLHPYELKAAVDKSVAKILLRDFDTSKLDDYANRLHEIGKEVELAVPGCCVDIAIAPQYRNLGDGLKKEPRAIAFAEEAHRRLGLPFRLNAIRGGTDGSQLTALGLPTPNLSSGQHNPHSPREFACVDEMMQACKVVLELLKVWAGS
jgi:tripeptide aminopeptidase